MQFYPQFCETLPLSDAVFMARLMTVNLLPGNTRDKIRSIARSPDKVEYFLDHVIMPNLNNDTSNLKLLLTAMKEYSGSHSLEALARDIENTFSRIPAAPMTSPVTCTSEAG